MILRDKTPIATSFILVNDLYCEHSQALLEKENTRFIYQLKIHNYNSHTTYYIMFCILKLNCVLRISHHIKGRKNKFVHLDIRTWYAFTFWINFVIQNCLQTQLCSLIHLITHIITILIHNGWKICIYLFIMGERYVSTSLLQTL